MRTFLLFLSEVPSKSQDRLLRLICRMLRPRLYLHKILNVRFHIMATSILIRQPCLLKRFCTSCDQCVERARFGQEILTELISQTDNAFGIGILEQHCSSGGEKFIYGLLNGLILLRLTENRNRFIQRWRPIPTLLDKIGDTLRNGTQVNTTHKAVNYTHNIFRSQLKTIKCLSTFLLCYHCLCQNAI